MANLIQNNRKQTTMKTKNEIQIAIEATNPRGAWAKARKEYALELLENLEGECTEKNLLNGADDWAHFSYGGSSLVYDRQIAMRLCNPSELKKTKNGEIPPNRRESWLDCQARCLSQAAALIARNA